MYGGSSDENSGFIEPTLMGWSPHGVRRLWQMKFFGPILPIISYSRLEDAIVYLLL
ncbi:aldehyde dehydrogenase family protein [Paenibacillus sp. OK076]|uniref:aldehyde dehydrogenase family protein n=1 Tax=unclassified Paenibacillus TaxID=185978 RepID=UPI003523E276